MSRSQSRRRDYPGEGEPQSGVAMLMGQDRLPPHSIEAEQGVLGCCLADPGVALGLSMERIGARREAFYDMRHQALFEVLCEMVSAGKPVDPIILQQTLRDRNQLEALGGMSYIAGLMNATPAGAAIEHYLRIVLEKWRLRRVIEACTRGVLRCYDEQDGEIAQVVNGVEAMVLAAGEDYGSKGMRLASEVMDRTVDLVEHCFRRGRGLIDGVATGFSYLDKMLGGLHNGEYGVIAARPSVGKSALMMGIVKHVAMVQKKKVGVFSVEMLDTALMLRLWCDIAGVNMQHVRTGFASEQDFQRLTATAGKLKALGIWFDDTPSLDIQTFRARARRMKREGCELIVLDYLQLMTNPEMEGRDRHLEVASISRGIKAATKELNLPIVTLAQLNRETEKRRNLKPCLADLRESGQIEQDADWVGLMYRLENEEDGPADENVIPINLLIAKQRNGPTGDCEFLFNKQFMRFEDRYGGSGSRGGELKAREHLTAPTAVDFKKRAQEKEQAKAFDESLAGWPPLPGK